MKKEICDKCPFRADNIKKPQPYTSAEVMGDVRLENPLTCLSEPEDTETAETCRGYVASVKKGCKLFKYNLELSLDRTEITDEDLDLVFPYFKYGQVHKC